MQDIKVYSYWKSPSYKKDIPPYVLLGLASAKIVLGDKFILLNDKKAKDYLGEDYDEKEWKFANEVDPMKKELRGIVAKSDYIRMAIVNKLGGVWIDADTIVLKDFTNYFSSLNLNQNDLLWYCEAFFMSLEDNFLLKTACSNMMNAEIQKWGNPGGLKDLIKENMGYIKKIPFDMIKLGDFNYSYANREIMLSKEVTTCSALSNQQQHIIVLYNTPFSETEYGKMTCSDFLDQDILLSKIFLKINPDKGLWLNTVRDIQMLIEG